MYACRGFLCLKSTAPRNRLILKMPFGNCQDPMLAVHECRLILTYVESCENGCYTFRFLHPLDRTVRFFTDLKYDSKPSYSIQALEGELLLTVVCKKKISIFHLIFETESNAYFLRPLPFFRAYEE